MSLREEYTGAPRTSLREEYGQKRGSLREEYSAPADTTAPSEGYGLMRELVLPLAASLPAGAPGALIGGGLGSLVAPGIGTAIGAAIGSGVTGSMGFEAANAALTDQDYSDVVDPWTLAQGGAMSLAGYGVGKGVGAGWRALRGAPKAIEPLAKGGLKEVMGSGIEAAGQNLERLRAVIPPKPGPTFARRVGEAAEEVAAQAPDRTASFGPQFVQGGIAAMREAIEPHVRQPVRFFQQSSAPGSQEMANALLLKNGLEQQLQGSMARQFKAMKQAGVGKGFRALVRGGTPEIGDDLVAPHRTLAEDIFELERDAGVMEELLTGQYTQLRHMPDYVPGILNKELRNLKHADLKARFAKTLKPEEIERLTKSPGKSVAFQSQMLPDEFYEDDLADIYSHWMVREGSVLPSALSFGGGKPVEVTSAFGARKFQAPKTMADLINYWDETGHEVEAKVLRIVAERSFGPETTRADRASKFVRALTSNVLLNKSWPLQLAEVSKGAAYGRGVRGWWNGGRIIEKLGLDAEVSGATRSVIDEMTQDAFSELSDVALPKWADKFPQARSMFAETTPLGLARRLDSKARAITFRSAVDQVDNVAKRAKAALPAWLRSHGPGDDMITRGEGALPRTSLGKLRLQSRPKGWTRALMKEAHEIMPYADSPEDAAYQLAKKLQAGDEYLPKSDYLLGGQMLTKRWMYSMATGEAPDVFRDPWGAIALAYRPYLYKASLQYWDDVLKPLSQGLGVMRHYDGVREFDKSMTALGMKRLMGSIGYSAGPQGMSAVVRTLLAGDEADDPQKFKERLAQRWGRDLAGSVAGLPAEAAFGLATSDRRSLGRIVNIPALGLLERGLGDAADIALGDPGNKAAGALDLAEMATRAYYPQVGLVSDMVTAPMKRELRR